MRGFAHFSRLGFAFSLAVCLLGTQRARAHVFEWLEPANTQVILVEDARIDFALRQWLYDRAHTRIDEVTFVQDIDPLIGMPMIQARRRAADRGVPIRFLYGRLGARVVDKKDLALKLLADKALKNPIEVIPFGGVRNVGRGLNISDIFHEKIIRIDAYTPNDVTILSGRNTDRFAAHNLDTTIFLRRIDPKKPYLGDQLGKVLDSIFETAKQIEKPAKSEALKGKYLPMPAATLEEMLNTGERRQLFTKIRGMLQTAPDPTKAPESFEAFPKRARTLTNDLIGFALTGIYGRTFQSRQAIGDDIVQEMAAAIAQSRETYLSAMSVILPPTLLAALKQNLADGGKITLPTNSREAHRILTPFGVAYEAGLVHILELMKTEKGTSGEFNPYVLDDPRKAAQADQELAEVVRYTHRKGMVATGDKGHFTFFTSHNSSITSQVRNNEVAAQFDDPDLAAKTKAIHEKDMKHFTPLSCELAFSDRAGFGLAKRLMHRLFLPFY